MPFTLAYQDDPHAEWGGIPGIPDQGAGGRSAHPRRDDRLEHFGTEALALRRACDLLPGPDWLELRLYGPDGSRIATQRELTARLASTGSTAPDNQEPIA